MLQRQNRRRRLLGGEPSFLGMCRRYSDGRREQLVSKLGKYKHIW